MAFRLALPRETSGNPEDVFKFSQGAFRGTRGKENISLGFRWVLPSGTLGHSFGFSLVAP